MLYRSIVKPFFDVIFALTGIVVSAPVFLLLTVLLFIANQGKPFFTQLRPGRDEKIFRLIKFRTMNDKRDAMGNLLPDAVRLTLLGKIVRKTSLDEIPQLLNVLKGDMSLVGPRPLLVEYLDLYSDVQKRRHQVKPGITGWAQVNGRNAVHWPERFAMDVWYVDHQSLLLDLKILCFTVFKVFKSEGISAANTVTMEKFKGNS
jgi:undecaprenyl phosphate N,N'-diacetylbacillosamine 1-phosphate transferase